MINLINFFVTNKSRVLEKIERYKWGMDVREHTF
jgi:hypothetical protein